MADLICKYAAEDPKYQFMIPVLRTQQEEACPSPAQPSPPQPTLPHPSLPHPAHPLYYPCTYAYLLLLLPSPHSHCLSIQHRLTLCFLMLSQLRWDGNHQDYPQT